tara:strand:- start:800 stop:3046 length:2247 start_codon:yes stop_codon:yes gene_type:complete
MLKNIVKYTFIIFLLITHTTRLAFSEIVKKIEINGNERIPIETINMLSDIKINDDINENDINNLLKNLYETNFFKNLEIKLDNNVLKISVIENPIISDIKIKGIKSNRIKDAVNEVLSIREKSSFNEIRLIEEKDKILAVLKEQGYQFAKIDFYKEDLDDNKLNLIFDIDLGDKAKIKKISFVGDKIYKDQKLKRIIISEEYKFWKILSGKKYLNEKMIKFDERLLRNFYLNKGYYNVTINSSFAKKYEDGTFELIYNIDAKNKVNFGTLELQLPTDYELNNFIKITDLFNELKGTLYSLNKINDILEDIDLIVLNEQFESISASVEEQLIDNNLNLKFIISETEKRFVEKINILGNNVTEETVIRNQLLVDEGDPFNEILTTRSINNIKSLNFFKDVKTEILDGSNPGTRIINISVEEKPTGEIMAGAGFGTSGSTFMFGVKENNFLGRGVSLDTNLNLSTEAVKGSFKVENRNYKNSDKSLFLTLDASETDRLKDSGYKFNKTGFDIGTRFEYFDDFFVKLGTSNYYERIETDSTASDRQKKQEGDYIDSFLQFGATLDKRNQKFQTSEGFFSSYSIDLPIISDTYTLTNSYRYKYFTELFENNVSSISLSLKSAHSLKDEDIKLSERLRIPSSSLRGFEYGKVGPKDGDDFIGGNYMSTINFTSTIPQILENSQNTDFIFFIDVANIWGVDYDSALNDNKIKSSFGIGLDWFSPAGPMNFSIAHPISKSSNDVTESFRFNLGTTF